MPEMSELSARELSLAILSKQFKNNLAEITGLSRPGEPSTPPGLGALFAVTNRGGALGFSEVLHADAQYVEACKRTDRLPYRDRLDYLLKLLGSGTIDLSDAPLDSLVDTAQTPPNTCLAVVAHSQPPTVWPTHSDLIYFGKHLQAKPRLILGMAAFIRREDVADPIAKSTPKLRHLGRLTLLRPDNPTIASRLRTLRSNGPATEAFVARIGLRAARLTFNPDTGDILTGLGSVKQLYL
jgi:hypothetical protein